MSSRNGSRGRSSSRSRSRSGSRGRSRGSAPFNLSQKDIKAIQSATKVKNVIQRVLKRPLKAPQNVFSSSAGRKKSTTTKRSSQKSRTSNKKKSSQKSRSGSASSAAIQSAIRRAFKKPGFEYKAATPKPKGTRKSRSGSRSRLATRSGTNAWIEVTKTIPFLWSKISQSSLLKNRVVQLMSRHDKATKYPTRLASAKAFSDMVESRYQQGLSFPDALTAVALRAPRAPSLTKSGQPRKKRADKVVMEQRRAVRAEVHRLGQDLLDRLFRDKPVRLTDLKKVRLAKVIKNASRVQRAINAQRREKAAAGGSKVPATQIRKRVEDAIDALVGIIASGRAPNTNVGRLLVLDQFASNSVLSKLSRR